MSRANIRIASAVAALLMLSSLTMRADSVKIIINSSVQANQISVRELKNVYLREKSSLNDGTHVEPVLARGGAAHEAFLKLYLKQNNDELQRYYQSLVFSGKGSMPKALPSEAEVVSYVAKTRGAIGYVSAETNAPGVKTLAVIDSLNSPERHVVAFVTPEYPPLLREQRIGGIVRLRLTVAAKGDVAKAEVLGGNPILGEAAVAGVQRWKFVAAAAQTVIEVTIPFDPH
jgi:TonB family protein